MAEIKRQAKRIKNVIRENLMSSTAEDGSILMLGLSQNGKSLLGNYLINGKPSVTPFSPGGKGNSMTKLIQKEETTFKYIEYSEDKEVKVKYNFTIKIIDTPGLLDSEGKDFLNLREIVTELDGLKIGTVILAVNFERRFYDDSFIKYIGFYRTLFPNLFSSNFIIVFTNVSHTAAKLNEYEFLQLNLDSMLNNEAETICKILGLRKVSHQSLNSMPFDVDDVAHSTNVRNFLLMRAGMAEKNHVKFTRIPKLPKMITHCLNEIKSLEKQSQAYIQGLTVAETKLGRVLKSKLDVLALINGFRNKLETSGKFITNHNTNDLELVHEEKFPSKSWGVGWQTHDYYFEVDYIIRKSTIVTTNGCYHTNKEGGVGHYSERGSVSSTWLRGLYGSVMVYAFRSDVFRSEIEVENKRIELNQIELKHLENKFNETLKVEQEHTNEVNEFRTYLAKISEQISNMNEPTFPIEEFDVYQQLYDSIL